MRQALLFVLAAPSTAVSLIAPWGKVHRFTSSKSPFTINTLKQTYVQTQELLREEEEEEEEGEEEKEEEEEGEKKEEEEEEEREEEEEEGEI